MVLKVAVGSKYQETKALLTEGIQTGTIPTLETIATHHACYFCERRIEGAMYKLTLPGTLKGVESETSFFLDKKCYETCNPGILYN